MSHADSNAPATDVTVPPDWERLWFMLRVKPWTSLAVVPAGAGAQADRAVKTLAAAGRRDGRLPVSTYSAVGRTATEVKDLTETLATPPGAVDRLLTLVACEPLHDNPGMIPVVHAASAVLLVVPLADSTLASVRTAVELIGRDRILATVSVG